MGGLKQRMRPNELSYMTAFIACMILLAISFYHFPISYWLSYVSKAPTKFGYSFLNREISHLVMGELWLFLILTGSMQCMRKSTYVGVVIAGIGMLFETGTVPFVNFLSVVEPVSGLYFIYKTFFIPFFLLFLLFFIYAAFKRKVEDPRILYSVITISFIPISLNVASWILSGYTGTGGGLLMLGLSFFLSWVLIWLGGLLRFKIGLILIAVGAVLNWYPFGIGIVMLALAYTLRMRDHSKKFYAAISTMLVGLLMGIYSILTSPMLT